MLVKPIPAFSDNYIWSIENGSDAVVVDPGDAASVLAYLKVNGLELTGILIYVILVSGCGAYGQR